MDEERTPFVTDIKKDVNVVENRQNTEKNDDCEMDDTDATGKVSKIERNRTEEGTQTSHIAANESLTDEQTEDDVLPIMREDQTPTSESQEPPVRRDIEEVPSMSDTEELPLITEAEEDESEEETKELVSILDFDPYHPQRITEPSTLKAMQYLGIHYSELKMPSQKEIDAYEDDDLKQIFVEHHRNRINRLIEHIMMERDMIMSHYVRKRAVKSRNDQRIATAEAKQSEILERRQRKELENLVQSLVKAEKMRKDAITKEQRERQIQHENLRKQAERRNEQKKKMMRAQEERERHEAEMKRKRELQIQKAQEKEQERQEALQRRAEMKLFKMQEYERIRQERMERNRDALQKIEEERTKRFREKEMDEQRRQSERLAKQQEWNERKCNENRLEEARKRKVLEDIRKGEEKAWQDKRKEAEEREKERQMKNDEFQEKLRFKRESYRHVHEEKMQRYQAQKERLEKERQEKNNKVLTDEEVAAERIKRLEQQKDKERRKKIFILNLKKEERDQNAKHAERQLKFRQREAQERRASNEQRINSIEYRRAVQAKERESRMIQIDKQKYAMSQRFKEQVESDRITLDSIRSIAREYGINVDDIAKRELKRPRTSTNRKPLIRVARRKTPLVK